MPAESFWEWYEKPRPRPIDLIADTVSPKQMGDFLNGCQAISILVERARPDVIFVPERGAGPVMWAVDQFLELRGKNYPEIFLPIGTHTDDVSGRQEGYNSTTKKKIIEAELEKFKLSNGDSPIQSIVLVDEVQSGATISTASRYIAQTIPDAKFYVIAVQDDRTNVLHKTKTSAFTMLATNERFGIETSVVPVPLFNVDRSGLLDTILRPSGAPKDKRHNMLMIMHNADSEELMRNLALAVANPTAFSMILSRARSGDGPIEDSACDPLDREAQDRLYSWTTGLINVGSANRAKIVLSWLNKFADNLVNHTPEKQVSV